MIHYHRYYHTNTNFEGIATMKNPYMTQRMR